MTDEWYIGWKRVTMSSTVSDNDWEWVVQWMTASGSDLYIEWQRVTASGKTNDNEWYNERQWVTTNDPPCRIKS